MLLENDFYRDTWVEIDLDCIKHNVQELRKRLHPENKLFAVVKANAYGHGAIQIARSALESGANYLAVAFLDEAISLRQLGITAPILVLGASRFMDVNIAATMDITLTVFDVNWLKKAAEHLSLENNIKIHLKIDSGMGRLGFRNEEEMKEAVDFFSEQSNMMLEGVFTHFSTADERNSAYLKTQIDRFNRMLSVFRENPEIVHCSNSAASLLYPELQFNAVRMGISMYGLTPSTEIEGDLPYTLKEAFSLHTKMVQVKKMQKGDKISYGATYEAKEEEWIATLPIGYADGWLRKLQGQEVLVDGIKASIVGRICMDQCMIKLPYYMEPGTRVTLIGKQKEHHISVNDVAKKLETINYEVTCSIAIRVPRVYRKGGNREEISNALIHQK